MGRWAKAVFGLVAGVGLLGVTGIATQVATAPRAYAQQNCRDTPEGRVCTQSQAIVAGDIVSVEDQKKLGLVTVDGGCSGALLNRFWVLTARHCVTSNNEINGPLADASKLSISAAWDKSKTPVPTRVVDVEANARAPGTADIALLFLGMGDFGEVDSHKLFDDRRTYQILGASFTGARLQPSDTVRQYGQGYYKFATSFSDLGKGDTDYRSADFSPSSITTTGYEMRQNSRGQVGAAGDSGGVGFFMKNGQPYAITGVQSTCTPAGYLFMAPVAKGEKSPSWEYATGIEKCQYVSVEPYLKEINELIKQRLNFNVGQTSLFQVHFDGQMWAFQGKDCINKGCPSWVKLDSNNQTRQLAAAGGDLYQLHANGAIWWFTGQVCSTSCIGWKNIGTFPGTAAIATTEKALYRLENSGKIFRYNASGWVMLDNNPNAVQILADREGDKLYQRHKDGAIWRFTGQACSGNSCPGWQKLDGNAKTRYIVGGGGELYQFHLGGDIWRFTGAACTDKGCPGWQKLDGNPATYQIVAGPTSLYQRHANGRVWQYTDKPCDSKGCPGWRMIDNDNQIQNLEAGGVGLVKRRNNGELWRFTGAGCNGDACGGWAMIDNNKDTSTIYASRVGGTSDKVVVK